jgi:two-component system NarL family response regulator
MKKVRVLVVDDHFMVRIGLAGSLGEEADIEVVAEAGEGDAAMRAFRKHSPDVTLLDGRMPGRHGVEILREMRKQRADAKIILLSVDDTDEDFHRAMQAGADGYVQKGLPRKELLAAIRLVHRGGKYLPPGVAERLASRKERPNLSPRELDILRLVALGNGNKQIAAQLGLAEVTVKVYVSRILEKLGVPDRTRASTLAIERGLVRL